MAVTKKPSSFSLVSDASSLDPSLTSLFSSSAGPTRSSRLQARPTRVSKHDAAEQLSRSAQQRHGTIGTSAPQNAGSESPSSISGADSEDAHAATERYESLKGLELQGNNTTSKPTDTHLPRKRKRREDNEQLEDVYLQRLAKEEAFDEAKRKKHRKIAPEHENDDLGEDTKQVEDNGVEISKEGLDHAVDKFPLHESLADSHADVSIDKASRTCFLGNVSSTAITSKSAKKTLLSHLSSFLPVMSPSSSPHGVESLRFRSTAFASSIPKKASFARKDLNDSTTKSTNAYVVYNTVEAAKAAPNHLNGTIALGRHLRVDLVSSPAKIDHRRCVFVGNLDFVDDTSQIDAAEAEGQGTKARNKNKVPGDVEEGLWRQFEKAGKVESVRVIRDSKTRVGKGFAYVQFANGNAVEAALLFNDKKFPPMLPRKLRVVRAKNPDYITKSHGQPSSDARRGHSRPRSFTTQSHAPQQKEKSGEGGLRGQMKKLLGKAGAADVRPNKNGTITTQDSKSFVFEGHRASSARDSNKATKKRGPAKRGGPGKSKGRGATRAAAWKAKTAGGKKK